MQLYLMHSAAPGITVFPVDTPALGRAAPDHSSEIRQETASAEKRVQTGRLKRSGVPEHAAPRRAVGRAEAGFIVEASMELRQPYRISCYRSETHCTRGIAAKFDVFKTTQLFAEMGAQTDARDFPIVIVEGPNGWRKKIVHGMHVEGGPFLVEDMN